MKNFLRPLNIRVQYVLALVVLASGAALASNNAGNIGSIAGANGSIVYVNIVNPSNGYAACAKQNRYVINITSTGGKSMYAIALAAKATGQTVTIIGAGVCSTLPEDAEDVLNVVWS